MRGWLKAPTRSRSGREDDDRVGHLVPRPLDAVQQLLVSDPFQRATVAAAVLIAPPLLDAVRGSQLGNVMHTSVPQAAAMRLADQSTKSLGKEGDSKQKQYDGHEQGVIAHKPIPPLRQPCDGAPLRDGVPDKRRRHPR